MPALPCTPVAWGVCIKLSKKDVFLNKSARSNPPRLEAIQQFDYLIEIDKLIPTAPAFDSFWDSQIRESLTRCWLLRGVASMGAAVSITRLDVTAAELRMAAGREKDGSAARRMLAIAMILDGTDRKTAAETCGMDRQTLRDWVHRYNAEGLTGLHDLTLLLQHFHFSSRGTLVNH